ncbi:MULTISPECIES: hypothetical protein [Bradyrhizobium]|uniref:hypothetical protein n=1 Tax=Bradyrhizobium TaxID=374 RepID=UPI001B89DCE6|nr:MULTISPECIES: hypothetical protein [Bradyrhizobium]MBR0975271.1 hypothetical protein [Bradyrhizobium japonicum]
MKWIRERDELIAQTMAFVQSVTGKKDDLHQLGIPTAAPAAPVEIVSARSVDTKSVDTKSVDESERPAPPPQPSLLPPPRAGYDFRTEMQARIANFRKHQERFEREREEYCAATLTKLRAAILDVSPGPPAEK